VGGIFTAEDAWEKLAAGAAAVELYTGFVYRGPGIISEIRRGLSLLMDQRGLENIAAVVGSEAAAG
jgi:dihydroorotate dehydrogenase